MIAQAWATVSGYLVNAAALGTALAVLVGLVVRGTRRLARLFARAVALALHDDLRAIRAEVSDLRQQLAQCPFNGTGGATVHD